MALPHEFKRIRLDLARSKEFPAGSAQHGYEFVVPLDAKGHIDTALWRAHRDQLPGPPVLAGRRRPDRPGRP